MRKLVACLACRNNGTRLYGKPLQNLDIQNSVTVLDYILTSVKGYGAVSETVLAISEGVENKVFIEIAKEKNIKFYVGSEEDVLDRLIKSSMLVDGTDIFILTTESPFTCFEGIEDAWKEHISNDTDLTTLDNLPDGSGFAIVKLDALQYSWDNGAKRHRSEYPTLYIRDNKDKFKISYVDIPDHLRRVDVRLTIDYPEDLVLCRRVYEELKNDNHYIPLSVILNYLDNNPELLELVEPYVDEGLKTMYL
jgi:spore coat polysaccharide biosynthesis protein SpsF